jgi:hypothetical protein
VSKGFGEQAGGSAGWPVGVERDGDAEVEGVGGTSGLAALVGLVDSGDAERGAERRHRSDVSGSV